jgi:hypothetical protein
LIMSKKTNDLLMSIEVHNDPIVFNVLNFAFDVGPNLQILEKLLPRGLEHEHFVQH